MDTDELAPDDDLVAAVGVTLAVLVLGAAAGVVGGVAAFIHRLKRAGRAERPHPA